MATEWRRNVLGYHFGFKFFLKRGATLETRAAHTHSKHVPEHALECIPRRHCEQYCVPRPLQYNAPAIT